jgi:hypothetical protein
MFNLEQARSGLALFALFNLEHGFVKSLTGVSLRNDPASPCSTLNIRAAAPHCLPMFNLEHLA